MAQYRNAVMTQNGAALLNKAQAGLCKIKFTRMSTGDGQYSESEKGIEELRKITSLKSHKQSFAFDSIKYQDDTSVELKASITNHDDTQTLSAGYYIREIAVFAQEDDKSDTEVLYSIAVADVADFLPTYNGNNPILIIQKYYVTVDESRSAITVPSHYGEDLDAVKEDLEKEWKEYAKNIDEEMKKRPEKDGKADEMTVTFTEAANRENIVTGEKNSTLMGKIKKWLADLAAAAFMQVVTSYSDLMAGTALDDYLIGAAAAKEGFTELNGKLIASDNVPFRFGVNSNGEYGYIITNPAGADTVIPFSSEASYAAALYNALKPSGLVNANMTFNQLIAVVASQNPATYSLIRSGWTVGTAGGAITPSASSNGSAVTLKIASQTGMSSYVYYTSPAINLSSFKTLTLQGSSYKVTGNPYGSDDYRPKVKLLNASGVEVTTLYAHPNYDKEKTTYTINTSYNCSSLSGNHYLRLQLFSYSATDSTNVGGYITLTKALFST